MAVVGGAGVWGQRYMRAYADRADCRIVAMVDNAIDRRMAFAEHYNVESVYDDVEALFADQVPDIVSVVLPVSVSPGVVIKCARAGVRVVSCEKPIAMSLAEADAILDACTACGTQLGCSTAYWESPHVMSTSRWLHAEQPFGALIAVSIAGGLPDEVSGGGCVQLAKLELMTGMRVKWVEGWDLPPVAKYKWPEGMLPRETDSPAYGRLGLSGGLVCEVPPPPEDPSVSPCHTSLLYEQGQVWLVPTQVPRMIYGSGAMAVPYYPRFFKKPSPMHVEPVVDQLVKTLETGEPIACDGAVMQRSLETAIGLKHSAHDGHRRIELPLADRSARLIPQPYRLQGGDAIGWENTHRGEPPKLEDS